MSFAHCGFSRIRPWDQVLAHSRYLVNILWVLNMSSCVREHLWVSLVLHPIITLSVINHPAKDQAPWPFSALDGFSVHSDWGELSCFSWPDTQEPYHLKNCPDFPQNYTVLKGPPSSLQAQHFPLGPGRRTHLPPRGQNVFRAFQKPAPGFFSSTLPPATHLCFAQTLWPCLILWGRRGQGRKEPRVLGPQWLGNSGGSEVQADNHHLLQHSHSPSSSWKWSRYEVKHLFCFQ